MNQKIYDLYFKFRKYQKPNFEDAFLFFITEVAEMAKATRATIGGELSEEASNILADIEAVGADAEYIVSGRNQWVRNGDRNKEENVRDEIADCLMMLNRLSVAGGYGTPDKLLLQKMAKKGFVPDKKLFCESCEA